MNLFSRIFNNRQSLKECPRCLGKGDVDWDDIKRLDKELKWLPGSCAYCDGAGKVDSTIENKVAVDTTYLANNLSKKERKRIINQHPEAVERASQFETQIDEFIDQVYYLHLEANLNPGQIAHFFLISKERSESYEGEKQELIEYIERVILLKGSKSGS